MTVNTLLKGELLDTLKALQLAATGLQTEHPHAESAFLQGYSLALQAVATAYGLEWHPEPGETVTIDHR